MKHLLQICAKSRPKSQFGSPNDTSAPDRCPMPFAIKRFSWLSWSGYTDLKAQSLVFTQKSNDKFDKTWTCIFPNPWIEIMATFSLPVASWAIFSFPPSSLQWQSRELPGRSAKQKCPNLHFHSIVSCPLTRQVKHIFGSFFDLNFHWSIEVGQGSECFNWLIQKARLVQEHGRGRFSIGPTSAGNNGLEIGRLGSF